MKNIKIIVLFISILALFTACVDEPSKTKSYSYNCVMVDMGNYSESNGSICLYNTLTGAFDYNVYQNANGRNLGAIIESASFVGSELMLMCNNADKLVFLDAQTMKEICEPLTAVGIPRYAAVKNDMIYVSSWQKKNKQTGEIISNHQIIKLNAISHTIVKTIPTSGQPEGILVHGDKLFVAAGSGLDVFDLTADTLIKHISSSYTSTSAQQLLMADNVLVLSLGAYVNGQAGFMFVNPSALDVIAELQTDMLSYEGDIALSSDESTLYFLYSNGVVGGQSLEVPTSIYSLNIATRVISSQALVSGYGFYGIGVNPANGALFTSNVNGFITNSMTYMYTSGGQKTGELMTGVGTSRYLFK